MSGLERKAAGNRESGGAVAHGIDLVEVERIRGLLKTHPERFVTRCFTESEAGYAAGSKRYAEHLAARFAAKEAVLKALGTGLTDGIAWTDVEVTRSAAGRPGIVLSGRAAEVAGDLGIVEWLVSLTHTGSLAMASVIGLGGRM
ncbi:holo-ACP synthase [Mucisphaera sp.]|uniref:holo-ACP synthase n=1 Tax=Mucisphaera sp. TaxID=2913024 RepID=UPI003D120FDC